MAKTNKQIREELRFEKRLATVKALSTVDVTCGKCGYKWTPNPRKWRNHYPTESAMKIMKENIPKYLKCPCCGNVILIPPKVLLRMVA